jgi:hypothetical protein
MAEANVTLEGLPQVFERLRSIPGGATLGLKLAIAKGLRGSRTLISTEVKSRYLAPPAWLKASIGQPRVTGLSGFVRISGAKAKLAQFGFRDIAPYGTAVQELREGLPSQILHAFVRGAQIYGREHSDTKRYPIRVLTGLSVSGMAGGKALLPKINTQLKSSAMNELQRIIPLILTGVIPVR